LLERFPNRFFFFRRPHLFSLVGGASSQTVWENSLLLYYTVPCAPPPSPQTGTTRRIPRLCSLARLNVLFWNARRLLATARCGAGSAARAISAPSVRVRVRSAGGCLASATEAK
jgi:hypothetical protein